MRHAERRRTPAQAAEPGRGGLSAGFLARGAWAGSKLPRHPVTPGKIVSEASTPWPPFFRACSMIAGLARSAATSARHAAPNQKWVATPAAAKAENHR
jgi:hypothetical protein